MVEALVNSLGISPLVATLLVNRKITDPEQANILIKSDLACLPDPFLMLGMETAVARILRAIENKESITVYGDYDVDGITAASFLVHFFRDLGIPFSYYLPNRMEEGYGVNSEALRKIREGGCTLVITADCGITAVREVSAAREIGLDVIVTDHHQIGEEGLPDSIAVLNPHQPGCLYPFRFLSGVGIVFKLATAIRTALYKAGWEKDRLPNLKRHLDLFALGTIADVAPLTGENHVLSNHGLKQMTITTKPGLVALKAVAGLNGNIDTRSVAFTLGPRLNAAGRLGKADVCLHLLTATDLSEAKKMARSLDDINQERQEVQKWTQEEAEYLLDREVDLENDKVIVLASENFHMGVIGIVASRFSQTYYRPTVLIALKDKKGKGSARSIPRFNLFKAFTECSKYLIQYGGHAYAAGLNIEESQVEAFRKAINQVGQRILGDEVLIPEINIDAVLPLEDITLKTLKDIQTLEPFGQGNPLPVFMTEDVSIHDLNYMGRDGQHVRFKAALNGNRSQQLEAVAFNMHETFRRIDTRNTLFDLTYELHLNEWNGQAKLQLRLLDLREHKE
jgi:single-stranded-DNA-specific exonuclease